MYILNEVVAWDVVMMALVQSLESKYVCWDSHWHYGSFATKKTLGELSEWLYKVSLRTI